MKLITLKEGKGLKCYNNFLESLGYEPTDKKEITIDRQGYSPEIAKQHGPDYMNGHVAIITSKQEDLDLANHKYSFIEKLLKKAYQNKEQLGLFDFTEPLFAKIMMNPCYANHFVELKEVEIEESKDNPVLKMLENDQFVAALALDTHTGVVNEMNEAYTSVNMLDQDPSFLIDEKYITDTLEKVHTVRDKGYKNIEHVNLESSIKLSNFSIKTENYQLFGIKNQGRCNIVYFGENCPKHEKIINGKNKAKVLDKLIEEEILEINEDLIKEKIEKMEKELLTKKGLNPEDMNPWDIYNQLTKLKDEIPEDYIKLWATVKDIGKFNKLKLSLKKEIVGLKSKFEGKSNYEELILKVRS